MVCLKDLHCCFSCQKNPLTYTSNKSWPSGVESFLKSGLALAVPRLQQAQINTPFSGLSRRWKLVSPLRTFIYSQHFSQAYPMAPHPCLLLSSSPSCLCFLSCRGTKNGMQGQTWDFWGKKKRVQKKERRRRIPMSGDGEEERRWGEKEKCTLYFSNGWEMIR